MQVKELRPLDNPKDFLKGKKRRWGTWYPTGADAFPKQVFIA